MALGKFQEALPLAQSKIAEVEVKRKIASSSLRRGTRDGHDEAIRIYKEIINDAAVPTRSRALAMSDMAFSWDLLGNFEWLEKAVFNEEPYAAYLRESGSDFYGLYGAARRIYEQSDALYPTAFAKLQIAAKYAIPLRNGKRDNALSEERTLELIEQYLEEGMTLISALPYEESVLAYMHLLRATALSAIADFRKSTSHAAETEAAYQEAIAITAKLSVSDIYAKRVNMRARLWYAAYLAYTFGDSRTDDIRELIRPIVSLGAAERPLGYLRRVGQRPAGDFLKGNFLAIARQSTEFQSLLTQLDWEP